MEISFKLEKFEGPLDLLLHLIDKNKVNIYDIPIAEITVQYMEYVNELEGQDLDTLSEFLVMAATLLAIKSKMLLPKEVNEEGEEEDPRAELVERLLEYKMYKLMSHELKDRELDAVKALYKPATLPKEVSQYEEPIDLDKLLDGITLARLQSVFNTIMKRQRDKIDPVRSKFGKIEREPVSIEDKMKEILEYAVEIKTFLFEEFLEAQLSKTEIIVTFLAVLELMKIGKLNLIQENTFAPIKLSYLS